MVVGGGSEIIAALGWSWVVAAKLWLVVGGRGWSHDLVILMFVMPVILIETTSELKANSHVYI